MPNQDDGFIDRVEHVSDCRIVVGERLRGVLNDAHVEAVGAQHVVDTAPTGSVDESSMDQDDGRTHGLLPCSWMGTSEGIERPAAGHPSNDVSQ